MNSSHTPKNIGNTKSVSVKYILSTILRDQPHIQSINLSDALEWTGEFIGLMGVKKLYSYYYCDVEVKQHSGLLPPNFKKIKGVKNKDSNKRMKIGFDEFPDVFDNNTNPLYSNNDYQIKGNYIYINPEEATLTIKYQGWKLDDDGFPVIPDEERVIRGLHWFITQKESYKMMIMDTLSGNKFQYIDQKAAWYMGSARYKLKTPDQEEIESIKNSMLRLIPDLDAYENSFATLGNVQNIKLR